MRSLFEGVKEYLPTRDTPNIDQPSELRQRAGTLKDCIAIQTYLARVVDYLEAAQTRGYHHNVYTRRNALDTIFSRASTIRSIIIRKPGWADFDARHNASILSNLILMLIYAWCAIPASSATTALVWEEEEEVVAHWALLPALVSWLREIEHFAKNHFRGSTYAAQESSSQSDRRLMQVFDVARQTWQELERTLNEQLQVLDTHVSLSERIVVQRRQHRTQLSITTMQTDLQVALGNGKLWILQRYRTWNEVCKVIGVRKGHKEYSEKLSKTAIQIAQVTTITNPYLEERDILWRTIHNYGTGKPPGFGSSHFLALERFFEKRKPLPRVPLSATVNKGKVDIMRGIIELNGFSKFSLEETTRMLCEMKVSTRFVHIKEQIPWLP